MTPVGSHLTVNETPASHVYTHGRTTYDVPAIVRHSIDAWLVTFQTAATVAGLLAAVESQLLMSLDPVSSFSSASSPAARDFIVILTYGALIFSLGAAIGSLVLIASFNHLPIRPLNAILRGGNFECLGEVAPQILEEFTIQAYWRRLVTYCMFTLASAIASAVLQIVLYVWLQESLAVKVTVFIMCLGVFGVLIWFDSCLKPRKPSTPPHPSA